MNTNRVNELVASMKSFGKEKYQKSELLTEMFALQQEIVGANFGQMGRLIRTEGALVSVSSVRSTAPWVPSAGTIRHAC